MSTWGYVTLGWVSTYGVIAIWFYTSRTPAGDSKADAKDKEST